MQYQFNLIWYDQHNFTHSTTIQAYNTTKQHISKKCTARSTLIPYNKTTYTIL